MYQLTVPRNSSTRNISNTNTIILQAADNKQNSNFRKPSFNVLMASSQFDKYRWWYVT